MVLGKRKWLTIALGAGALVVVLGIGLFVLAGSLFETKKSVPTLQETEAFANVKFPAGANLTASYSEGWQDYSLNAVVRIDASDLDTFLNSIRNQKDSLEGLNISQTDRMNVVNTSVPEIDGRKPAWWQPDSARKFTAVSFTRSRYTSLLISRDDPTTCIIYVYAFSM